MCTLNVMIAKGMVAGAGSGDTYGTHADAGAGDGAGNGVDADAGSCGAGTSVSKTIARCWEEATCYKLWYHVKSS